MENIRLILPSPAYLQSYLEACRELKAYPVLIDRGFFHDPDAFPTWEDTLFATFENHRQGIGLPAGYVPATTFWLVEGDTFIGRGSIRHRLTPALERFAGHIGYAIRPSRWGQGYGTLQLSLLLREAFAMGIQRTLITCDEDNIGSRRVIEKNGGLHEDTISDLINGTPRRTCRYWHDTAPTPIARSSILTTPSRSPTHRVSPNASPRI